MATPRIPPPRPSTAPLGAGRGVPLPRRPDAPPYVPFADSTRETPSATAPPIPPPPTGPAPAAAAPPPESGPAPDEESAGTPWYRTGVDTAPSAPSWPAEPPAPPEAAPRRTRPRSRKIAVAACLVLGLGLLVGAAAGSWLTGDSDGGESAATTYAGARAAWHSVPVDEMFPRTLRGDGVGPGGADRTWTRVAVAPDSSCGGGFDPLLDTTLSPVGCKRLLRATYTDATSTSVTTVGLMITKADTDGMRALSHRFDTEKLGERTDLMPRTYPAKGTVAEDFGDEQRASWRIRILTDAPAVVYAVTGYADGRTVPDPQPAADATEPGATSAPAQAGLGHDARGISDGIERAFERAVADTTEATR